MNATLSMTRTRWRPAVLSLVGFAWLAPGALAQEQGPVEEIVITGSRISAPNMSSTSPVQVVSQSEIQHLGKTDMVDILNTLPQVFQNSATDFSNTSNSLSTRGGLTTVNLRGLGPQRTLVLVDGRRLGTADANTGNPNPAPNLDQIPVALIERVDVVTGGASAVYGSDAIAGVVNFIMRKNFEGLQIDDEWFEWEEQGFRWWAGPLAQRIFVARGRELQGIKVSTLHIETDLLAGVPATAATWERLAAVNRLASLSAYVADVPTGTVSLHASVAVTADNWPMARLLALHATALQVSDAHAEAAELATAGITPEQAMGGVVVGHLVDVGRRLRAEDK